MKTGRSVTVLAAIAVTALAGAAVGAFTYAALDSGGTKTVVRQVTVPADTSSPASSTSLTVGDVYRRAHKGVVEITVSSSGQGGQAQGSGFVYDEQGHIVTNQHVVEGADSISVKFWNGATYKATLVGADTSTDLAVLKIAAPQSLLQPIPLGSSAAVQVGDAVVAIGSPFGLEETVTSGIVSALHRQMTSPNNFSIDDSLQTDAAINHGNSGGPLLDMHGKVIGVNAQIQSDSGGNDGVGFAIPSDTVRSVASQLISSGRVEHAYLGIVAETIPASAADSLGLAAGVEVAEVRPGTPADDAGLRAADGSQLVDGKSYSTGGDVIVALNGTTIRNADELRGQIDALEPGDELRVTYVRGGKRHTTTVTLASRPS